MVKFGSRNRDSWRDQCIRAFGDPMVHKAFACFIVFALFWIWFHQEDEKPFQDLNDDLQKILLDYQPSRRQNNPLARCLDSDDRAPRRPAAAQLTKCLCPDPMKPWPRPEYVWAAHHRRWVYDARQVPLQRDLDVVLLGDSLVERWNGTKALGQMPLPAAYRAVWEEHFDMSKSSTSTAVAQLEGMALGSSGDTSTELLWHLENKVLPDNAVLSPKVWVILIGTNDLGRLGCSKRNTLAGILHVALYLHENRPGAPIILHGLLPRSDNQGSDDYSLGKYWDDIMWINRELKRFAAMHDGEWYYMDASSIFLRKKPRRSGATDTQGALEITSTLMPDGRHPSVEGLKQWAPLLVEQINARIRDQEKKKKKNSSA